MSSEKEIIHSLLYPFQKGQKVDSLLKEEIHAYADDIIESALECITEGHYVLSDSNQLCDRIEITVNIYKKEIK